MKAWNYDPKEFLTMNLKLVKGVQFSNPKGEILASLPDCLAPTLVTKWQYRMMLSLDGEQQFIEVVRDVKNEHSGEFEATDVWMFLDWLVENDLVENAAIEAADSSEGRSPRLPHILEPKASTRPWMKVPLQAVGILLACGVSAFGAYKLTPLVIASFNEPVVEASSVEVAAAKVEPVKIEEASTAVRTPQIAEAKEVTFAARAKVEEMLPPVEEAPSLVEKLVGMRQEMAACQIRRDEYYLLNDEAGYRKEVEKISELVKEIGQIRADITE
ncbi:MAG: hypothetical protein P1U89_26705 [Verrucomicrobiales bacterium]|nr:hypothetical protein [Verrucomicrobiales bacterium]